MIIRELCGCSLITKGLDSIVKYGDHCSKHSPNNKNELINNERFNLSLILKHDV